MDVNWCAIWLFLGCVCVCLCEWSWSMKAHQNVSQHRCNVCSIFVFVLFCLVSPDCLLSHPEHWLLTIPVYLFSVFLSFFFSKYASCAVSGDGICEQEACRLSPAFGCGRHGAAAGAWLEVCVYVPAGVLQRPGAERLGQNQKLPLRSKLIQNGESGNKTFQERPDQWWRKGFIYLYIFGYSARLDHHPRTCQFLVFEFTSQSVNEC